MNRAATPILMLAVASGAAGVQAAERSAETVWTMHCEGCHRPDAQGPGPLMLGHRFGESRADIASNPDLDPTYLKQVVRSGFLEMAPFRNTEISDRELDALIDFLLDD